MTKSLMLGILIAPIAGFGSFLFISGIVIAAVVHYLLHRYVFDRVTPANELPLPGPHITHGNYTDDEESQLHPKSKRAYPIRPSNMEVTTDLAYYAGLLGLKLDEYEITTKDGFIIVLQHLYRPSSKAEPPHAASKKKPVLFVHGLMQSSASFLTSGFKSLAYFMVDNGYDVWLGNNRCGFNAKHEVYDTFDPKMWDWDLNEMAQYDIPAMIHFIQAHNNHVEEGHDGRTGKVTIMAHSQGTAQCVYLMSKQHNNPCIANVDKCILFAPAVYGGPLLNDKLFIKFMRSLPDPLYDLFFGINSFMPILNAMRRLTYKMSGFGLFSYIVFSYLFDWNDYLWDVEIRKFHFLFSPVYVSNKLMKWWLRAKHGAGIEWNKPIIKDDGPWFTEESPDLFMIIGGKDNLVNGDMFVDRMAHVERQMEGRWDYIKLEEYSHLDVLWADDILDRVGHRILNFLQQ